MGLIGKKGLGYVEVRRGGGVAEVGVDICGLWGRVMRDVIPVRLFSFLLAICALLLLLGRGRKGLGLSGGKEIRRRGIRRLESNIQPSGRGNMRMSCSVGKIESTIVVVRQLC